MVYHPLWGGEKTCRHAYRALPGKPAVFEAVGNLMFDIMATASENVKLLM